MRRDASLEPDGLKVPFYRSVWEWIKQDVIELIVTKSTTQVIELPGLIIETVIVLMLKLDLSKAFDRIEWTFVGQQDLQR